MKWIKKLFKKNVVSNQKGSTLSMALIVIAVLSFTVTTVTGATITLSSTTQQELFTSNDESLAKGLITQSINESLAYLEAGGTYSDYNNTEIARIFNAYGVIVEDVTSLYPDFGDNGGVESKVYRFSHPLNIGTNLVKYVYLSTSGSTVSNPHPWSFSMGTNGDLILNGGYYDDISMFGKSIYHSRNAIWHEDDILDEHLQTPYASSTFPELGNSEVYYTEDYQYCNATCFTVDPTGANPYVINKNNYSDIEGSSYSEGGDIQTLNITDFFSGFDFDDYINDQISNNLPVDNRTTSVPYTGGMDVATFEAFIRSEMDVITYRGRRATYPNTAFYDITNDSRYDLENDDESLRFSAVYDGDLTINRDVTIRDEDGEALIVLGDLTFDNTRNGDQELNGTYVVTGNLYFTGNSKEFDDGMFIVFGETYFRMDDFEGVTVRNDNRALTLMSYDNIIIDSMNESNDNSNVEKFVGLFYTEESLWIDAVNSKLELQGSFYAKAKGESNNPIPIEDQNGDQVNGIVINSFKGYAVAQWGWVGPNWWDWGYVATYVPSSNDTNNRFYIQKHPENRYDNSFFNLPDLENVTASDGELTSEISEWSYED